MNKRARTALTAGIIAAAWGLTALAARADETCLSPYTAALIKGQEAYLHVWTLGDAVYSNKGEFLSAHPIPVENGGDGYGYDIAINPKKNVFLTSSFTGWNNYMMDLGKLIQDAEAMKHFGNSMVLWNLKSMQPEKISSVPGAPLEIRWSLKEGDDWAITASALTSKLWLVSHGANNEWQAKEVGTIGALPVDISISADAKTLWVNTFMDGTTHLFDISDPTKPVQIYEKVTGKQVNMISQSWDGKRVYITSSLLANWDKKGADNEQVLRAYDWDGKDLNLKFEVDFIKEKLGRSHHMKFSGPTEKASLDIPGRAASR